MTATKGVIVPALILTASLSSITAIPVDYSGSQTNLDITMHNRIDFLDDYSSMTSGDMCYENTNYIVRKRESNIVHEAKQLFGEIRSITKEESRLTMIAIEEMSYSDGEVIF